MSYGFVSAHPRLNYYPSKQYETGVAKRVKAAPSIFPSDFTNAFPAHIYSWTILISLSFTDENFQSALMRSNVTAQRLVDLLLFYIIFVFYMKII